MKLDPALFTPEDRRALHLIDRVDVELAEGPGFDLVFDRLWAAFGPRGEMEDRALLLRERMGRQAGVWSVRYFPMLFRLDLTVAAVRDCMVAVGPDLTVVLLSHVLVEERARRTGIAAFARTAPLLFAPRDRPTLLFAEMEPLQEEDPPSRSRLVAYHRAGFSLMGVGAFPYCQPDFSHRGRPIPLIPVLRPFDVRRDDIVDDELPVALLRRGLDALDAIHAHHDPGDLAIRREVAEAAWAGRTVVPASEPDAPELSWNVVHAALPERMGGTATNRSR